MRTIMVHHRWIGYDIACGAIPEGVLIRVLNRADRDILVRNILFVHGLKTLVSRIGIVKSTYNQQAGNAWQVSHHIFG